MKEHDDRLLLEERLADCFQADSDTVPPTSSIDLSRARIKGRAMRLRRRVGGAGFALVAAGLVAVVLATNTGMGGRPASLDQPGKPSLGTKTGVSASVDPLQVALQFAALPGGFVLTGADAEEAGAVPTASDGSTRLTLLPGSLDTSGQGGGCGISGGVVYVQAGSGPGGGSGSCGTSASADSGAASIDWVYKPGTAAAANQGFAELVWSYAPNRYATLQASLGSMGAAQLIRVMTEVVQNGVRTGPAAAAAMPFHLPAAPAGLTLAYAYSAIGHDGGQVGEAANGDPESSTPDLGTAAGLEYGGLDAVFGSANGLAVTVQSAAADFPTGFETQLGGQRPSAAQTKTLTVNGHTARTVSLGGYEALIVHDVNGFDVRIAAAGASALAAVNAAGGLVGYFDKITFYGTDPDGWTYDVIGSSKG